MLLYDPVKPKNQKVLYSEEQNQRNFSIYSSYIVQSLRKKIEENNRYNLCFLKTGLTLATELRFLAYLEDLKKTANLYFKSLSV